MFGQRRIEGVYPYHGDFAFRLLNCLKTVCGTLSRSEVDEWFAFDGAGCAVRRFKRVAFRVYTQMYLKKSLLERLKGKSYLVRIRFIRRVRGHLCEAWKKPSVYALYREVVNNGFDREAFIAWWIDLKSHDRLLIVHTWAEQIKKSVAEFWLTSLGEDLQICVRMAAADSSTIRTF